MKRIVITLDEKSIGKALKEIDAYNKWVKEKTELLCEKLAIVGAREASVRFATAMYDGNNDVTVEVGKTDNGWVVTASGEAVCFIEFGAGVYHNPSEPYPNPRPEGIVGIGEYGKGYGKRRGWKYEDSSGELVFTRGNPAAMPLWYATKEMEEKVLEVARAVFSNGQFA